MLYRQVVDERFQFVIQFDRGNFIISLEDDQRPGRPIARKRSPCICNIPINKMNF